MMIRFAIEDAKVSEKMFAKNGIKLISHKFAPKANFFGVILPKL
jgi:hypothetical protein